MARPATASLRTGSAAALLFLTAAGCSSPSRAPETDVIEVERIDLTTPKDASDAVPGEDSLVLPGAASSPASSRASASASAPASAPTETVPAPESK